MVDHEILYQQSCHEELQQLLAPKYTTEWVEFGFELEGFGEIFRYLSYQEIGSAAIMSRAVAGVFHHTVVFSIPGSEKAVRLAMDKLILNELGHIVREMGK